MKCSNTCVHSESASTLLASSMVSPSTSDFSSLTTSITASPTSGVVFSSLSFSKKISPKIACPKCSNPSAGFSTVMSNVYPVDNVISNDRFHPPSLGNDHFNPLVRMSGAYRFTHPQKDLNRTATSM